jgi:hypothetical protein
VQFKKNEITQESNDPISAVKIKAVVYANEPISVKHKSRKSTNSAFRFSLEIVLNYTTTLHYFLMQSFFEMHCVLKIQ